jgi:hypothetical protein
MSDDKTRIRGSAADGPAEAGGRMIPLRLLAWLPWIAAGGFALLAGFLSQAYFAARSEILALREQGALAAIVGKGLQQRIEAERILSARRLADLQAGLPDPGGLGQLKIVSLVSAPGFAAPVLAIVLWDQVRQEGELVVANLTSPAPDKDYQLWIMDPQYPDPVGAGVLTVGTTAGDVRLLFKPDRPVATAARFAVSLERKGGVPRAEGPIVLSSQ